MLGWLRISFKDGILTIASPPADHPDNANIDFTDVIRPHYEKVKKLLGDSKIILREDSVEVRDGDGKFKSFTISI